MYFVLIEQSDVNCIWSLVRVNNYTNCTPVYNLVEIITTSIFFLNYMSKKKIFFRFDSIFLLSLVFDHKYQ